jgi:putative alpha-1,2-mannosidase
MVIAMVTTTDTMAQPNLTSTDRELAGKILQDGRMDEVLRMGHELLKSGMNAGSGYSEVWIRDLNTFIVPLLDVAPQQSVREALLVFFHFQGEDGNIIDGYVPKEQGHAGYNYRFTESKPGLKAHKNTVETDQESSLVQAVCRYIRKTRDATILDEMIRDIPVRRRLEMALDYPLKHRWSEKHGLIWGATTADWGDIQPEHPWGVDLDENSHRAIDIYDNAMMLVAIGEYLDIVCARDAARTAPWNERRESLRKSARKHLWDAAAGKFIPHIYLEGSPFPEEFDENRIFYHGGTAVAIEAGLLTRDEIAASYQKMRDNMAAAGAATIGLTVYPPYPEGFFKSRAMVPYSYQNGGDWTWFGARIVRQLASNGFTGASYHELEPMLERVIKHRGFYEWWTPDNQPKGSAKFRGSAGVLIEAIQELREWARHRSSNNLAPLATIKAPGKFPEMLTDGIKGVAGEGEWITASHNNFWGGIAYPELELKWDRPRTINKVVIYDRPCAAEHMAACVLRFSDGSEVQVAAVPNDGSPKTVLFAPRQVTSLDLSCVDGVGSNIGLSELEVFHDENAKPDVKQRALSDLVSHVDPTIETGRGRWFFCTPGSRPFGMVCASAYTRNKNQQGGGYNYNSTEILGFAQIHCWLMSGINLMPTTGVVNPNQGEVGWKSAFSHDTEVIEPGYHKLILDRYQTQVEYTSTERVAFYRLQHRGGTNPQLLLQLGGFVGNASYVDGKAKLVSPTRLEGSHGMTDRIWGGPKLSHVFFVIDFNRPIRRMDGWMGAAENSNDIRDFSNPVPEGRLIDGTGTALEKYMYKNLPEEQAGVALAYDATAGDEVLFKIGISYTSIENARNNLETECPHWDFDKVRNESRETWNDWLGRITVKGGPQDTRVKFYTDLWHVLLGRHKINDLSGDFPSYMGPRDPAEPAMRIERVPMDKHGNPLHHMYNSDALWLTMWNLNILWGLGWPEIMDEFSASMVRYADLGGRLPRGPAAGGYTDIMTGCPATSLITATWQKDLLTKVDPGKAYQTMKTSHPLQLPAKPNGPGVAVQGAFEYWALAQMAAELGHQADAESWQQWIDSWKPFFDPKSKLLHGRWIEANDWQGTFGVAHDIDGLAQLMGGPDKLAEMLNSAFEEEAASHFVFSYGNGKVSYANQPGCSNAHVFSHVGHPWLSQYWVRRVSTQAYGGTDPNTGYGGHDEDQGQMGGVSALMKIGLFSLQGTSSKEPVYEITTPEFDEVTIQLDPRYYPGKEFRIVTHDNTPDNVYIQKAELNGRPLDTFWFHHKDFAKGGLLELWLGPEPNTAWGRR